MLGDVREITGIRGLAALYVTGFHALVYFVYHGAGFPGPGVATVARYGWIGVDFFFVLSAFLLSLPLLARRGLPDRASWLRYWGKRLLRIAPPYYASLLLILALFSAWAYVVTDTRDFLLHVTYLHTFHPDSFFSLNPVYWTLALELQLYILLPLLVLPFTRRSWPAALAVCVAVSLVWRATFFSTTDPQGMFWLANQFPAYLGHFALGIAAARLHRDGVQWRAPPTVVVPAALGLLVAVPLATLTSGAGDVYVPSSALAFPGHVTVRTLVALGFAIALLSVLQRPNPWARALASRPVEALGNASYSLYLVHMPIMVFTIVHVPVSVQGGFYTWLGVSTAASVLAAFVFYAIVERPSLALKQRLFGRAPGRAGAPRPVRAAAARSAADAERAS